MKVVIAGGGTGGHLFPGVAIAEELRQRGHEMLFIGTAKGIEARYCEKEGWPLALIEVTGIKGKGMNTALRSAFAMPKAIWQARRILQRVAADCVVGVGGYASGPVGLATLSLGKPLYLLEQNSVPGITNRVLGRVARQIFGTFEEARQFFPIERYRLTGNPLRRAVREAFSREKRLEAPDTLLIVGGSQGAHGVNTLVSDALIELHRNGRAVPTLHQCGHADFEALEQKYRSAQVKVELLPFIDRMEHAYRRTRLVIGRAGATTISELLALGLPSVLIPLPNAADDHQSKNAAEIAAAGAAVVCSQATTTGASLAVEISSLFFDSVRLAKMSAAALGAARRDAHTEIADAIVGASVA